MELTRAAVLAHRGAVQGLRGGAEVSGLGVLALGFVDSPPKTGAAGLAVRVGPDFLRSGEVGRGPDGPDLGRLGSGRPGSGAPDFGRPKSDGPDLGKPDLGKPDLDRPDLDRPELGRPDLGKPEPGRPELARPKFGKPVLGMPKVDRPGLDRPAFDGPRMGGPGFGGADLDRLDRLVRVLSLRGAPHLHLAADLPALRRELRPRTPRQLAAWIGGFDVPDLDGLDPLVELLHREFPGERATKGELSAAVGPHLPPDWTPWCEPCGAHHVVDGLFRLATLLAGIELDHVGAKLVFRKPSGPVPVVEPGGEPTLLRAYARLVGPFAKADAEKWLGAGPPSAWPEGLRPVTVEGKGLLALEDVTDAPPPPACLLLFPRDPYLLGPRWLVAPDAAVAKRVWRPVGSPGALVVHGVVVGDWRYTFSGRTVTFHVRGWKGIKGEARTSLRHQTELLAAVWGGSALEPDVVEWSSP